MRWDPAVCRLRKSAAEASSGDASRRSNCRPCPGRIWYLFFVNFVCMLCSSPTYPTPKRLQNMCRQLARAHTHTSSKSRGIFGVHSHPLAALQSCLIFLQRPPATECGVHDVQATTSCSTCWSRCRSTGTTSSTSSPRASSSSPAKSFPRTS